MVMQAVVIEVQWDRLLVLDLNTRQKVIVITRDARWWRPGDQINIWYNGSMTKSIPPQIFALSINAASPDTFPPPPGVRPPNYCPPSICPPVIVPPILLPPFFRPPNQRPRPR